MSPERRGRSSTRCSERKDTDRVGVASRQSLGSAGVACLVLLVTWACGASEGTARGVAKRFLDAHYVRIDLPAAREYTAGLAREKIDEETRLTAGQVVDSTTRVPRVHYSLADERVRGADAVSFEYDGTVHPEDAAPLYRTLQLKVRRSAQGWKVTNYHEVEVASE